jgi:signal transduction histidine kinase
MNSLRIRFAIGFSVLFTVFLAIALFIVYVSYADFRKEEFYKRLKDRALTAFKLLIEVEQIDHDLLQVIDKNTLNTLYDEKVMIFEGPKLIYNSIGDKKIVVDTSLLKEVKTEKKIYTTQNENELVALHIQQGNKEYVLLAAAFDKYGQRKTNFLKLVMIIVYFAGLAVGWITTFILVRRVIAPLDALKKDLHSITSANLHTRLKEKGQSEEVDSLSVSFNQMLERLQQSFSIQKDFVHYASHELRTPLTAMVGITENALTKTLSPSEHNEVLQEIYQQQKNLTGITNSLLLLSDNRILNEKEYPKVRLDELVFNAVEIVQNLFPKALIEVNLLGNTTNEEAFMVRANEPLLLMAFNNLLKNAVQYSYNNSAIVSVKILDDRRRIEFRNKGGVIEQEEKKMIFTPFFRASNVGLVKGHGLGLSLVRQIAELHKASIQYDRDGEYNVFYFDFPSIQH